MGNQFNTTERLARKRQRSGTKDRQFSVADTLVRLGVVKDKAQADKVLFAVACACFLLALYIFATSVLGVGEEKIDVENLYYAS